MVGNITMKTIVMIHGMCGGGWCWENYKEFANHAHWVVGEPGWQEIAEYISDWLNQV